MKDRIENLEKYQKKIISKMGLDDDMSVRTYKDIKERKPKNPMDNNKDENSSVQVRKKVSFSKAVNRTYAALIESYHNFVYF